MESIPHNLIPRRINGITDVFSFIPPAFPQAATMPECFVWEITLANIVPPTVSTTPSHNPLPNSFGSSNGTQTLYLKANGYAEGSWSETSDIALKENISDINDATTVIKGLRPVNFDWKKEGKGTNVSGFIAQEVKEVIDNHPEIKEGFDLWSEDDIDGRQRVGASALEIVLTKAVQELSAKVEDLENKLNNK